MSKVKSKRNVGRGSSSKGSEASGGKVLSKRQLKKSSNKKYVKLWIIGIISVILIPTMIILIVYSLVN
ncbi:MAG: hypothetical protein CEE43_02260 [Promethearchaeota archaeon Loki_b32]|nr:MAG: hypothetical protein CEE43_02260 [Candidatus Lokiarchaeota archaeon Loki_b32]